MLCRDNLVTSALGSTSYGGVSYTTTAQNITGLLAAGSVGINHGMYYVFYSLSLFALCSLLFALCSLLFPRLHHSDTLTYGYFGAGTVNDRYRCRRHRHPPHRHHRLTRATTATADRPSFIHPTRTTGRCVSLDF